MSVTIAIPFYNAENFLPDAIRSVFAQTHKEWELLLIDDGSTDGSLEIAQSIIDPRVRVIADGQNKKLAARLNEVTDLAKYDYIARMDADDLMSPERIARQLMILENNKEIDVISTGVFSVLNDLSLIGSRGQNQNNITFEDLLHKKTGIVHAAVIARKSWYNRNKYDESLSVAQDLDLWLRSSSANDLNVMTIAEPLYVYREEGNVTSNKILRAYTNERRMVLKYATKGRFKLLAVLRAKSAAVKLISAFGLMGWLLKRRGSLAIEQQVETEYWKVITSIRNTFVPGLKQ